MEHKEWLAKYTRMRQIADYVRDCRIERARRLTAEAGLAPDIMGIHLHNAWVSYLSGKPWRGVDYDKVRQARWECDRAYEGSRIIERWDRRVREF